MKRIIKIFNFLLPLVSLLATHLEAEVFKGEHVDVELVSENQTVVPGKASYLALRMNPEKDWHVYWKYHGDSGLAPSLKWEDHPLLNIGSIEWPYPERIQVAHLVNYGYSRETFFPIKVQISKDVKIGEDIRLKTKVSWLVCKEECIPGSSAFEIKLRAAENEVPGPWSSAIEKTLNKLPLVSEQYKVSAAIEGKDDIVLRITSRKGARLPKSELVFFPDSARQIENAAEQRLTIANDELVLSLKKPRFDKFPEMLSGILVSKEGWTETRQASLRFSVPISKVRQEVLASSQEPNLSVGTALIFALIGGLILNLMPCVFPILSIKVLNFVQQGDHNRRKTIYHAGLFAAGVLISFWVLAGLLMFLQYSGFKLGWGFQLQSPSFVVFMIYLLFLVGLNLYGFFEIGGKIQNVAGRYSAASGYSGSFLSGVLATLLATPCTAPFMGAAIAYSLASSAWLSFIIFTFLAVGMALPYVVLSTSPSLLSLLPRPGPWMELFKQFLAFPIFGTVLWLIFVLGQQVGTGKMIALLLGMLLLTFAIWIFKNFRSKHLRFLIVPVIILIAILYSLPYGPADTKAINWQAFSKAKLESLLAEGKPVFIDFTADWCLTCKINKFVVFSSAEVNNKFTEKKVVMLQADWTSANEEITEELKKYGRSGVPLNVLYYGAGNLEPYIFPSVLTPSMVLEELVKVP